MSAVEKLRNDIEHDFAREQELDGQLVAAQLEEETSTKMAGADIAAGGDSDRAAGVIAQMSAKVRGLKAAVDSVRESRRKKILALRDATAADLEAQAQRMRVQAEDASQRFAKTWDECQRIQGLTETANDIIRRFNGTSVKLATQADALDSRARDIRNGDRARRESLDFVGVLPDLITHISQNAEGQPDPLKLAPAAHKIREWSAEYERTKSLRQSPRGWAMLVSAQNFSRYERSFHVEFSNGILDITRSSIMLGERVSEEQDLPVPA